jgi:hypothetical protein
MEHQIQFTTIEEILPFIDEQRQVLNYFYCCNVNEFTKCVSHYTIFIKNYELSHDLCNLIIMNRISMIYTNSEELMKSLVNSDHYYTDDDTPNNRKKRWTLHFVSNFNDNN